jgi:hypothetical protein
MGEISMIHNPAMKKEALIKKWMHQYYMDELQHYSLTEGINSESGFYHWDQDHPKIKEHAALLRKIARRKHSIYAHFGFKKGKIWQCEADYKIERLFHNFCYEPDELYKMFSIHAAAYLEQGVFTLKGWLEHAAVNNKDIYDVPQCLYRAAEGWSEYLSFLWRLYKDGVINTDQLINEMNGMKKVKKVLTDAATTSDEAIKPYVLNSLKVMSLYLITLPTAGESHKIAI